MIKFYKIRIQKISVFFDKSINVIDRDGLFLIKFQ